MTTYKKFDPERLTEGDIVMVMESIRMLFPTFKENCGYEFEEANIDPMYGMFGGFFSGVAGNYTEMCLNEGAKLIYVGHKENPLGKYLYFLTGEIRFFIRVDVLVENAENFKVVDL